MTTVRKTLVLSIKKKKNMACENCKLRANYEKNPKSLAGRFHLTSKRRTEQIKREI